MTEELNYNKHALHLCTNPTLTPGPLAANEVLALDQLAARQCHSAPWLLEVSVLPLGRSDHDLGIAGGHCVFILMFKVAGRRLTYNYLHGLSPTERQEIRDAFRLALL